MMPKRPAGGRARLAVVGLMVGSLFAAMFVRLWYLQVLDAPRFQVAATQNQVREVTTSAPRGLVVDRTGQVMVGNQTTLAVTLSREAATSTPAHLAVIDRLGQVLGMSRADIQHKVNDNQFSPYEPVPVATGVDPAKVVYIEEHKDQFAGVEVKELSERSYPQGSLAAQTLGYTGPISASDLKKLKSRGYQQGDLVGESGVERAYEQWLRGQAAVEDLEVNAKGQVIGSLGGHPATPGDTVQLSIDLPLQQEVESALTNEIGALQRTYDPIARMHFPAPDGAALVLDPNNGQVLAMASYPSYDPSVWNGGISNQNYANLSSPGAHQPLENRAVFGSWAPGSTFKLATATAALDAGLIGPGSVIDDPGVFTFPGCHGDCPVLHNAPGDGALGPLTVTSALTASDDVFFYTLGYRFYQARGQLGMEAIQNVAHAYGLGVPTQFALGDSSYSWVDSPTVRKALHAQAPRVYTDTWFAADNVEMAFGQGLTVITPLQLADAYAAFANGGTVWQPQIAAQVLDHAGHPVTTFTPKAISHVNLPPDARQAILSGLEGVTTNRRGTAYGTFLGFPFDKMTVAGKTGTATTNKTNAEPTALFVAFAPTDQPKYVVVVVIDQAGYGASGAAPVARQVLQWLIDHPVAPVKAPTAGDTPQPAGSPTPGK